MLKPYFKMEGGKKEPVISESEVVVGDTVEMSWNIELEVEGLKYDNEFMLNRDELIKFLGKSLKAEKYEENEPQVEAEKLKKEADDSKQSYEDELKQKLDAMSEEDKAAYEAEKSKNKSGKDAREYSV